MDNDFGFFVFFIISVVFFYLFYIVWFSPQQYLRHFNGSRKRLRVKFPWMPEWLIGYIVFWERPPVALWLARFLFTLFSILLAIMLIGVIRVRL